MTEYTGQETAALISLYLSVLQNVNANAFDVNSYLLSKICHPEMFFFNTFQQNNTGHYEKTSLNLKWQIARRKNETSKVG